MMETINIHGKDPLVQAHHRKRFSFFKSHWGSALAFGLTLITFLTLQSAYNKTYNASGLVIPKCGPTVAEAKAQGCVFDLLNYSWTPPACYDKELSEEMMEEEFKARGPWRWYLADNFTQEIPQDVEDLGTRKQVYVEHRYHVLHCLGTWRTLHRSVMDGRPGLVPDSIDYGHTTHCTQFIRDSALDYGEKPKQETVALVFSGCVRTGDR
ncbi:hypothetical protein BU24DRAFT_475640 [Aaosphaeria arxii CBS 175.79]|uniref:Uncharacterized protein n=1 Tax=Aaosphaeria arxii CBS 175.79 TaxID=1450172 RepID=A0A6A5Y001_9PLEO|nr:uncharacterized protein BU24DRAFT_475640 [Aaosphaeria arxii CBS 175.79]KAF2018579.1 hypothetical protein BU24DRAFT_475640 [Aaosphaeria arxii CBS 175.79]